MFMEHALWTCHLNLLFEHALWTDLLLLCKCRLKSGASSFFYCPDLHLRSIHLSFTSENPECRTKENLFILCCLLLKINNYLRWNAIAYRPFRQTNCYICCSLNSENINIFWLLHFPFQLYWKFKSKLNYCCLLVKLMDNFQ